METVRSPLYPYRPQNLEPAGRTTGDVISGGGADAFPLNRDFRFRVAGLIGGRAQAGVSRFTCTQCETLHRQPPAVMSEADAAAHSDAVSSLPKVRVPWGGVLSI